MEKLKTLRGPAREGSLQRLNPYLMRVELVALVAAAVVLLALFAPRTLFLPVLSPAAMAVSALAALLAWASKEQWSGNRITIWDVSGAFAFVGGVAAMLSKPENVLPLFGQTMVP